MPSSPAAGASGHRSRAAALVLCCALTLALGGCGVEDVRVKDYGFSDDTSYVLFGNVSDTPRRVFYTDDEQITLSVRFGINFIATYKFFRVRWIPPHGNPYLYHALTTNWGTHTVLATSMKIRGEPPAKWPGEWRVQLELYGRQLMEETFEIRSGPRPKTVLAGAEPAVAAAPAAAPVAAGSKPFVEPLCPDPGAPAAGCNYAAPQEGPWFSSGHPRARILAIVPGAPAPGAPAPAGTATSIPGVQAPATAPPAAQPAPRTLDSRPRGSDATVPVADVSAPRSVVPASGASLPTSTPGLQPAAARPIQTPRDDMALCPDPGAPGPACPGHAPQE